ncbi:c-type cytochrome biogenesis protein CcsB [Longispora albida]|uniref:c-type cytochrome biogenesis protein CcsB n=1 Tax=Longispora albida TaxID=203523 RepID=UPI00036BB5A5|nr:c-type cytochrome biogenesis protein CcsB [Longispora albida]
MSGLSDSLLPVAILVYTLAMLGYAVEYAFSSSRGAPSRQLVTVGAGGPPSRTTEAEPRNRAALGGKIALVLTWLGAAAHLGTIVTRGIAAERMPLGNMYEFVVFGCFVAIASWLGIVTRRPNLRHLGLYATLVVVLLLGIAATTLFTPVGPLVPALDSYWLAIHVTAASISSGVFLIGFVPAVLFLIRNKYERLTAGVPEREVYLKFPVSLGAKLPRSEVLERLTFRIHVFAFPIWTFAGISGAIWAEAAWGRYWGWDPKEVWLFISWVVYAGYLHARATPSVRRTTAIWIAIIGWVTMLVNLFGINFMVEGLHSYAGL